MYIFRWLLSHPILFAWMLAAFVMLLTQGTGHKESEDHTESSEAAVHGVAEQSSHVEGAIQTQQQEAAPVSHDAQITQTINGAVPSNENAAPLHAAEAPEPTTITGQFPEPLPEEVLQAPKATDLEPASMDVQAQVNAQEDFDLKTMPAAELLVMAREAFWQNEKDKSAAIYQILIERDPSSLVYKGELGNVYWHQNKQKESAALYADIAIPMIKAGKSDDVANMLGFIGVYYPEKAREIHRHMSSDR